MKIKYNYTLYNKSNPFGVERQAVAVGELCKKPDCLVGCDKGYIFIRTKSDKIHMIETSRIFEIDGKAFTPCCHNCASFYMECGCDFCKKNDEPEEDIYSDSCGLYELDKNIFY